MALTRKMLKGLGIGDDQIDTIIEAHSETVDALKEERDRYKESADKLEGIQTELNTLKGKNYESKYNDLKTEFENYKTAQTQKEAMAAKEAAYRKLLKKAGVSEKRINSVLKVTDLAGIEMDEEGSIKDADDVIKSVKEEWADFIVKEGTQGAGTHTPPAGDPGSNKNTGRAKTLAQQYHDNLYGKSEE